MISASLRAAEARFPAAGAGLSLCRTLQAVEKLYGWRRQISWNPPPALGNRGGTAKPQAWSVSCALRSHAVLANADGKACHDDVSSRRDRDPLATSHRRREGVPHRSSGSGGGHSGDRRCRRGSLAQNRGRAHLQLKYRASRRAIRWQHQVKSGRPPSALTNSFAIPRYRFARRD
jgi:hypothetical protein